MVHDPLYNVRSNLKKAVSKFSRSVHQQKKKTIQTPIPEFSKLSIAPAFEEELKVPKPVQRKKTRVTVKVPSYLSGQDMLERKREKSGSSQDPRKS